MSPVSPVFHTVVTVIFGTQKCIQSESIHSTIVDVHVLKAERQNSPFLFVLLKLDKDLTLSPQFPLKLVMDIPAHF